MTHLFPIILSGGSGTRLWPLSRERFPKQFIPGLMPGRPSLFAETVERLGQPAACLPTIICNTEHRFLVNDALKASGKCARKIILEPVARNTAPAIAIAALDCLAADPDAVLVVMPSDHAIGDCARFAADVQTAARVAQSGRLVLFGIEPDRPHTGFGYIEVGHGLGDPSGSAFEIAAFREKPDAATAESYAQSGQHLWNAGIFVMRADHCIAAYQDHAPAVLDTCRDAWARAEQTDGMVHIDAKAFAEAQAISIDYAIMEHAGNIAVIKASFDWSDIGNWQSLWHNSTQDGSGNAVHGDVLVDETSNALIRSDHGLVATFGLNDVVVVNTADATIVADMARAEAVGALVEGLAAQGRREATEHLLHRRPWGYFEVLAQGDRFQVKKLYVEPGGQLSMQMHHHRSEHWVVVSGTAKVTLGETTKLLYENESTFIAATQWHRLENPGRVPLEIIEVQAGTYLGEDDIVRKDDAYGRAR